jgi:hypothetical protein
MPGVIVSLRKARVKAATGLVAQQLFGDPEIGDAPIGLGEALRDAQALQKR